MSGDSTTALAVIDNLWGAITLILYTTTPRGFDLFKLVETRVVELSSYRPTLLELDGNDPYRLTLYEAVDRAGTCQKKTFNVAADNTLSTVEVTRSVLLPHAYRPENLDYSPRVRNQQWKITLSIGDVWAPLSAVLSCSTLYWRGEEDPTLFQLVNLQTDNRASCRATQMCKQSQGTLWRLNEEGEILTIAGACPFDRKVETDGPFAVGSYSQGMVVATLGDGQLFLRRFS